MRQAESCRTGRQEHRHHQEVPQRANRNESRRRQEHEQRELGALGAHPEASRRLPVEAAEGERPVKRRKGDDRPERQGTGRDEVSRRDAQRVAEEDLAEASRHLRPQGQEHAGPEERGDDYGDRRVGANPALATGERDRDSGDAQASARPHQQRKPGEGRDHQAR